MFLIVVKDKGEKKFFGFVFLFLMRDDGIIFLDDIYEFYVYKVWGLVIFYFNYYFFEVIFIYEF